MIMTEETKKYRPFNSKEECWKEMHNHPDFGWVKNKHTHIYSNLSVVDNDGIESIWCDWKYDDMFEEFTFTDGAPFGVPDTNTDNNKNI